MWRRHWRDPEEKFTFAVCAVALVIVIAKVWFAPGVIALTFRNFRSALREPLTLC